MYICRNCKNTYVVSFDKCPNCNGVIVEDLSILKEVVNDPVNHPKHYTSDPSGVECITITRHRNFNIGNAIKYLWRAGLKIDPYIEDEKFKYTEDLKKAIWYINDEIKRIEAGVKLV